MGTGSHRSSIGHHTSSGKSQLRRQQLSAHAGRPESMLETLENRILLGGDHPSFMLPLDPDNSTQIVLDGDGIGSETGLIDPAGDDDLFSFVALDTDFVTVWADTLNTMDASDLDSRVEVYDIDGMLVAQGSTQGTLTGGTLIDGWAGFVAEAGETYFVRVMSDQLMGTGSTGNYIIRVDAKTTEIVLDTGDAATKQFGQGVDSGTIAIAGNDAVFRVTTGADEAFDSMATIGGNRLLGLGGQPVDSVNTRLDIYDATGKFVAKDSQSGRLTNAFQSIRSGTETTWYIRVRADEFIPGGPEATGQYQVLVDFAGQGFAIDPVTRVGKLRQQGPVGIDTTDIWTFIAQGTGLTFITAFQDPIPPFIPPQTDTALRIFNSSGVQLAFNDDLVGTNSQIEIPLVGGEQYWVVVDAFDEAFVGGYALTIEAHHTFNPNMPVDDHVDTPDLLEDVEDEQVIKDSLRQLEEATPLVFDEPFRLTDQWNNLLRDFGWYQTTFETGRIHEAGDSDLFQFTVPVDHLGEYEGDNDDEGLSVYVGGQFTNVDTDYLSQRSSVWDGEDWFPAGQNFADGSIYAQKSWDADEGGPAPTFLFAGGDFTTLDDADINFPFPPTAVPGLAYFDRTQYNSIDLGDVFNGGGWFPVTDGDGFNGPVYAMEIADLDDDGISSLYVGGDFTTVDGMASAFLVQVDMVAWSPLFGPAFSYTPVTGIPGPVHALATFRKTETWNDDGDLETEYEEPPGQGWDGAEDTDLEPTLIVGGEFGAVMFDGTMLNDQFTGFNNGLWNGNATVYAIDWFDPPDIEGPGGLVTTEPEIILAGDFTNVNGIPGTQNVVRWVATEIDMPPPDSPSWSFEFMAAGSGADGVVRALQTWDGSDAGFGEVVVAGGEFENPGVRISAWDGGGWVDLGLGLGMDDTVHTLTVIEDADYVQFSGQILTDPIIFAGGEFTSADGVNAANIARFIPNILGIYTWQPLAGGTNGTVFSLETYDDDSPNRWDRHDQPAQRVGIVIAPLAAESFLNTFLTLYDSNLQVVAYLNETIAPPFPDPSGTVIPSWVSPDGAFEFEAPPMWAGETYYLEVTSSGGTSTGRYAFSLTTAAMPPDVDGSGVYDNIDSIIAETPDAGNWQGAQNLELVFPGGFNDIGNGVASATFPYPGNHNEIWRITPSGNAISYRGDYGLLERPDDTDLFFFRAPVDGPIEVRLTTFDILDEFAEVIANLATGGTTVNTLTRPEESPSRSTVDTLIRVFNNDFVEIAFNDDNFAIKGDIDETFIGTFDPRQYRPWDPRVIFDAIAGEGYFIQVEGGQREVFLDAMDTGDFSKVAWRRASGSYQLQINAGPDLDFDDDYINGLLGTDASANGVIPIDEATGDAVIFAEIDNTQLNPVDIDSFEFIAVREGPVTLTVQRTSGQLEPDAGVFEEQTLSLVTAGNGGPDGNLVLNFNAKKGERFFIQVRSLVLSQGEYTLTIDSQGAVDDHASVPKFFDATELVVLDFNGTASASGSIEHPGDTDVFFFEPTAFDLARLAVTATSPFFDPLVRIYEVGVDLLGTPKLRLIAFDDDGGNDLDSLVEFSVTPPDRDTFIDDPDDIAYNGYYVVVSGSDRDTDFGGYTIEMEVSKTDDHPDIGQFAFATPIGVVPSTGLGEDEGEIEKIGDSDLFRFTAPATGPMTINVVNAEGSLIRSRVTIYDAAFNVIATDDAADATPGDPDSATVSFDVDRQGQYYVLVEGIDGTNGLGPVGAYSVLIDGPILDAVANKGEFGLATNIVLAPANGNGMFVTLIDKEGDTDLFSFATIVDGNIEITVSTPGGSIRPVITLFDQNQTVIATATDGGPADLDGVRDGAVTIQTTAPSANITYYALVEGSANLDPGEEPIGNYTILVDGPDGFVPPDNDDHADAGDFPSATPIFVSPLTGDGTATGEIEEVDDTDLFTFVSLSDGVSFVHVITPIGAVADLQVRIYGPDEEQIAFDATGIPGVNAATSFAIAGAGEQYYIEVDGVGLATGTYTIKLDSEPQTHFQFFPEGFANNNIDEFVSVFNPNDTPVTYSIVLRYENPDLPVDETVVVSEEVLGAGMRSGATISQGSQGFLAPGVIKNTPYAIIVTSDGPLGASLSHYDFNVATGESFTDRTSDTWTFARAERVPGAIRDFLVFYNPNDHQVSVSLTARTVTGQTIVLNQIVGANRRSGWDLNAQDELPNGVFGIVVESEAVNPDDADEHIGIVASLTHFDVTNNQEGEGFSVLGDADGGSTVGVIPSLTNGGLIEAELVLFNPTNTPAVVTILGKYIEVNLSDVVLNRAIAPGQTIRLVGQQLGFVAEQPVGLRYVSNTPLTVQASETQNGDSNSTTGITHVGQSFFFGDAFINTNKAGQKYFETIDLYNPATTSIDVTLIFSFSTGAQSQIVVTVGAGDYAKVDLHELNQILNQPGSNFKFFGIEALSSSSFAATLTHYDLFLNGGWTAAGSPLGITTSLADL